MLLIQLLDPHSSDSNDCDKTRTSKRCEINVKDIDELMESLELWYNWPSGTYKKNPSGTNTEKKTPFDCNGQLERILGDLRIVNGLRPKRDDPSWTQRDHDGIAELSQMIATAARNARAKESDGIVISLAQALGL